MTGDGSMHIYNTSVLYHWMGEGKSFYSQYLTLSKDLDPNRLVNLLIFILLPLMKAATIEKVIVSILVIGMPLALQYASRRRDFWVAVLAMPMSFNYCLQQGFLNYYLAVVLMFWAVGYYTRHYRNFSPLHQLMLSLLLFASVMAHGFPIYFFGLYALLLVLIVQRGRAEKMRSLIQLLMVAAPSLVILLAFMLKRITPAKFATVEVGQRVYELLSLSSLNFLVTEESIILSVYGALLWSLLIVGLISYRKSRRDGFSTFQIYFLLLLVVFYVFSPEEIAGTGPIDTRLQFILLGFLVLVLIRLWGQRPEVIFGVIAAIVFITLTTYRVPKMHEVSRYIHEVSKAQPLLDDDDICLAIHFDDYGHWNEGEAPILPLDNTLSHVEMYMFSSKVRKILTINNFQFYKNYFLFYWNEKTTNIPIDKTYPEMDIPISEWQQHPPMDSIDKLILLNPSKVQLSKWLSENPELDSLFTLSLQTKHDILYIFSRKP